MELIDRIRESVMAMEEEKSEALVKEAIDKGVNAGDILNRGIVAGLEGVGITAVAAGKVFRLARDQHLQLILNHLGQGIGRGLRQPQPPKEDPLIRTADHQGLAELLAGHLSQDRRDISRLFPAIV